MLLFEALKSVLDQISMCFLSFGFMALFLEYFLLGILALF